MKILHFHDSPHIHGGATQYLTQVLKELGESSDENHLFSLGSSIDSDNISSQYNFKYRWPWSPLQRRRDFFGIHAPLASMLAHAIESVSPDLIHIHNCSHFRQTVFSTILYSKPKSVMTVHDFSLNWDASPQCRNAGFKGLLANLANRPQHEKSRRTVLDAVDMFLCPTRALMDGLQLPAFKSRIHRLPIQPTIHCELPTDKLRIFFAGTLFASKGVDILIDALAKLDANHDFEAEIAGSGDQLGILQDKVAHYCLNSKVRLLGQLSPSQMNEAYSRSNLQVLPSRVPENSPLTVLEAGSRGRASIASHAGGVPELITADRGWTFQSENSDDLANKLHYIANDMKLLSVKGENMRKWVSTEFDPATHWAQLQAHYSDLIS